MCLMIRKNILSIVVALIIAFLSLASAEKIHDFSSLNFRGLDKIVHFIMYFIFMSVILFENRNRLVLTRPVFFIGLIPFLFGSVMELLQSLITTSRSGGIYDLLFNLAGILFSIIIFLLARYFGKEKIKY
jgi:VanZ family protein